MKIYNHLKLLMLVSFALTVATMAAGNVDSRAAQAKAIQFLNSQTDLRFNASNANLKLTHAEQSQVNARMNDFYVFNCDGGGYVIVPGDDRAEEILGYGSGYFDMNNLPDNVAWWMDHYKEQMEYLLAHPKLQVQTLSQQMPGKLTASDVPAMLTCQWDQDAPFYNQCPIYNYNDNIHCRTGAVATAMAQVMYYWKYPAELPALDAYEIETHPSIIVEELPGITLDWDNMRDDYSSSYTTIQADAVAWLMRYCSQAVQTQYSTQYSRADRENIRDAMINFGYSLDATIKYRDDYDATDWHAMMQAELEAGRPILYGGMALANNSYEEHTFVVDGYNAATNRYHVNFGFRGMYNSFFALDAFIIHEGYTTYTFNLNQMMFIGLYPDAREPEAYACYTPENTTLTFYYDKQRSSRPGTAYDLNTGSNNPGWYDDDTQLSVTQVVFDPSFAAAYPTTTSSWFRGMYRLQSPSAISGMEYLNTDEVTNMSYMFSNCSGLTGLDLSHFNTAKVTDMTSMFDYCPQLFLVYVGSAWNTDAVTQSTRMFSGCYKLKGGQGTAYNNSNPTDKTYAHIDGGPSNPGYFRDRSISEAYTVYTQDNQTLSFYYDTQRITRPGTTYDVFPSAGWYNKNLVVKYVVFDQSFELVYPTSTHNWFNGMRSLESITGIRYLKTDSVTDMSYMFFECGLSSLEMNDYLSYFNTANVKRMEWMFEGCNGLTTLDLTNFNTANVTDMSYMFDGCNYLTTIYVGDGWSNESVTNSEKMFMYCISLVGGQGTTFDYDHVDGSYAHIDGGPSNPGYFTAPLAPSEPEAYACYTPDNTTLTFYYDDQRDSRPGTTYDMNTGNRQPDWILDNTYWSVTNVVFDPSFAAARPTSTISWFYCMENVQSIDGIEYLNTSEVTNMAAMFISCSGLTSLDLSGFNTDKMTEIFNMFNGCVSLTSLDLSSFNTSSVIDMRGVFENCSSLTSLDLSSFNTASVHNMNVMFNGCSQLATITVGDGWNTDGIDLSYDMFQGCTSLVGGQGTTYDPAHVDVAYAHIDGGTSNPGYFSEKGGTFLRGDVNGDGSVSISDVTTLIDYLLSDDASGVNLSEADCNRDGSISISDVTSLIDYLLSGTWN